MAYAIKAEIEDPQAETLVFAAQKTMYGGKHIAEGDIVFLFASENEGGQGLFARGIVTSSKAIPRRPDLERQTPRVSITIRRTALATKRLSRDELKRFKDWNDGRPETELNFKFYRRGGRVSRRVLPAPVTAERPQKGKPGAGSGQSKSGLSIGQLPNL